MRRGLKIFTAGCLAFGMMSTAVFAQNQKTISLEGLEPPLGFAMVIGSPVEQVLVSPEDKTILVVRLQDMTQKQWNTILNDDGEAEDYLQEALLEEGSELINHSVKEMEGAAFLDAYFERKNGTENRVAAAYVDGHVCTVTVQTEAAADLDESTRLIRQVFDQLDIL